MYSLKLDLLHPGYLLEQSEDLFKMPSLGFAPSEVLVLIRLNSFAIVGYWRTREDRKLCIGEH